MCDSALRDEMRKTSRSMMIQSAFGEEHRRAICKRQFRRSGRIRGGKKMGDSCGAEVLGLGIASRPSSSLSSSRFGNCFDSPIRSLSVASSLQLRTLPRHFRLSPSSPHKGGPNPITLAPVTYVERLCTDPKLNQKPPNCL